MTNGMDILIVKVKSYFGHQKGIVYLKFDKNVVEFLKFFPFINV